MVGMECGRADSSEWHAKHAGRDSLQWHAWYAGALTHCNGTHGMRTRDSLQWHAMHVGMLTHGNGMLEMSRINVIFLTNVENCARTVPCQLLRCGAGSPSGFRQTRYGGDGDLVMQFPCTSHPPYTPSIVDRSGTDTGLQSDPDETGLLQLGTLRRTDTALVGYATAHPTVRSYRLRETFFSMCLAVCLELTSRVCHRKQLIVCIQI